jgi:hypothetical protein
VADRLTFQRGSQSGLVDEDQGAPDEVFLHEAGVVDGSTAAVASLIRVPAVSNAALVRLQMCASTETKDVPLNSV